MREWMKRYIDPWLPLYYILPFAVSVSLNTVVYYVTQWMSRGWKHWNMETTLDRMIPVLPGFTVIYFLFFLFCTLNTIVIAHQGRKLAYRFLASDMLSRLICGFFFLVCPTTNVRPADLGTGLGSDLLRLLYDMDLPVNLFPSIHCLASWMCFVAVPSGMVQSHHRDRGRTDLFFYIGGKTACDRGCGSGDFSGRRADVFFFQSLLVQKRAGNF